MTGGFRCRSIEWRKTHSTVTDPRCHGNEIWDKIGHNSVYIRDIHEIFAYNRRFLSRALEWSQTNCTKTNPVAMATKVKTKSPLTLLYKKYLRDALVWQGVFRDRLPNDVSQILRGAILVVMATNLRQNRLLLGLYMYIMRYSKTANINVKNLPV